jgi:hypothetical protein
MDLFNLKNFGRTLDQYPESYEEVVLRIGSEHQHTASNIYDVFISFSLILHQSFNIAEYVKGDVIPKAPLLVSLSFVLLRAQNMTDFAPPVRISLFLLISLLVSSLATFCSAALLPRGQSCPVPFFEERSPAPLPEESYSRTQVTVGGKSYSRRQFKYGSVYILNSIM